MNVARTVLAAGVTGIRSPALALCASLAFVAGSFAARADQAIPEKPKVAAKNRPSGEGTRLR